MTIVNSEFPLSFRVVEETTAVTEEEVDTAGDDVEEAPIAADGVDVSIVDVDVEEAPAAVNDIEEPPIAVDDVVASIAVVDVQEPPATALYISVHKLSWKDVP